jgi:integrase
MSDRISFTKKELEALPVPEKGRTYVHDTKVNGLVLQITPTGTRSFQAYRKINGKPVRVTLGRYPDMTIEQARKAALAALSKLAGGVNPNDEKKTERAKTITLEAVFKAYLIRRKTLKPGTIRDMERSMKESFADWMKKPVTAITPEMVVKRHAQRGKQSEARSNLAMRYLRALFNFAAAEFTTADGKPIIDGNPVKKLSQTRAWYKVDRRQTVIHAHDLAGWARAVGELPNQDVGDFFMFLLLTGLRRTEAASLPWGQIDLRARTLTVIDPKNRRDHALPLSDYLFDMLSRRKAEAASDLVFPVSLKGLRYWQDVIMARAGIDFCNHDLRRTFATIAESLDIPGYALKRLLNHANGADVTAGYIVANTERLREPMQKITDYVLKCAGLKETAEVIELKRDARR